ncbi:MAG: hypothetical protein A2W80_19400 [Candidatus Riflebacteria bacterium GWC2_50_8]|nr:MAG: hypothetical protein A2W80_19400 [Candidatus Riflebacteria bacterium GWC2_50_8]
MAQTVAGASQQPAGKAMPVKIAEEEIIILDPKTIDLEKAQAQFWQLAEPASVSTVDSTTGSTDIVSVVDGDDEDIDILVVDETELSKSPGTPVATEVTKSGATSSGKTAAQSGAELVGERIEKSDEAAVVADKAAPAQRPAVPVEAVARQAPGQSQSSFSAQPAATSASAQSSTKSSPAIDTREASSPKTPSSPVSAAASATSSLPVTPTSPMAGKASSAPAGTQKTASVAPASAGSQKAAPVMSAKQAASAPGARPVLPPEAREIAARYPSFLVDPFVQLFVPASNEARLVQIGQVLDNLTAFLNICYLQSCLFFAPESEVLARSIIECIKGELVGPTALRCLHNFVMSMKQARGNPVFFTFSLAGVLSDTSDSNPLMMMRELKEFLREPVEPLDESVPQAVEGITEILRGVKSIVNNLLVMKAPPGAKEPFADLSGPEARILPLEKRPALDVPVGEVVLISRDGTEALGLFPYFKYSRKKVVFAKPSIAERNILLERLEIPVEEF